MEESAVPKKRLNTTYLTIAAVILFLFIILIVRPGIIGYGVYQKVEDSGLSLEGYTANVQELESKLAASTTELTLTKDFADERQKEAQQARDDFTSCEAERQSLEKQAIACEESCGLKEDIMAMADAKVELEVEKKTAEVNDARDSCLKTLNGHEEELRSLQENYDLLVANTARSICCKARVDDPSINSYEVINDKVSCLNGGEKALEC
ncbi:hypothetical protein COV20_00600 [Candidatus Woesearchaeota archaeon CG10_big_fil_rev_8_21_14_0_10_45_16]|nr:MAG: hypothetical protein COV20_00600 [Candidatus Woesearchaeota archaeon CG10_big_fil_rev_8_21_14_0_10_45_16]